MSGVEFVPRQAPPAEPPPPAPPSPREFDDELPPPPAGRRRGLGPRSLTVRLVVGVVALVVVVVGAIGIGTYFALRSFLLNRLDQQVSSTAAQNAAYIVRCIESTPPPLAGMANSVKCFTGPPPSQHEWVVVLTDDGSVFATFTGGTVNVSTLSLNAVQRKSIAADADQRRTVMSGDEKLRVTGQQSRDGRFIVVTGLSTDEVDGLLHRLIRQELLIGAAAVILASFATAYGVQFSLRRLRQVTTTANEVAAELSPTGAGLDRRVDVPDDGSEVGQLAESMNTLLSTVETQFAARLESEARLRQFLADASHELRTPLTSIRGYAELARMQRAAGADADDNLSRIESEGTRMSRLVEDLLTLARGEQGASAVPARELVDVGELVDDAARDSRAAFPNRRVDAQPVADLHLIGDHDQLLRAIRNLISNAAVHTAPERPILVRCLPDGDSVLIQVIDGGPGLPPEEAAHVFERFWRADKARTRVRGGSGLGLSIVSAIVAAHGGTVRFDSSVETGSTVTVRLPAVAV